MLTAFIIMGLVAYVAIKQSKDPLYISNKITYVKNLFSRK